MEVCFLNDLNLLAIGIAKNIDILRVDFKLQHPEIFNNAKSPKYRNVLTHYLS